MIAVEYVKPSTRKGPVAVVTSFEAFRAVSRLLGKDWVLGLNDHEPFMCFNGEVTGNWRKNAIRYPIDEYPD